MNYELGGQRIHFVSESVKSLERWFDEYLKFINQAKQTPRTLQEGLHKIVRCLYKENSRFGACSIYLFRCYYGRYSHMKLRRVRLNQWRLR